jgi:hypothetical protein
MTQFDRNTPWYHGSPESLPILRKGSWVTQFKEMAKAFSHRPKLISLSDDGLHVKHDGQQPGFLYMVAEPVAPEDVAYLQNTAQTHWQTQRDLQVALVAALPINDPPQLTKQEIAELLKDVPQGYTGFKGAPDEK